MFSWSLLLGALAYIFAGLFFWKVIAHYIGELAEDVAAIDARYVDRMYFTVGAKSKFTNDILEVVLFAFWPIVDIAALLRAERQYDIIVRHSAKR